VGKATKNINKGKKKANSRIESSAETYGFRIIPLLPPEPLFDRFAFFPFLVICHLEGMVQKRRLPPLDF
jgi:hypothetical protein